MLLLNTSIAPQCPQNKIDTKHSRPFKLPQIIYTESLLIINLQHLSPPWPLSPSWSEACFLGTDQVIDPEQQTKARTIFCFLTDL